MTTTPSPERQPADAGGGLLPCPFCGGEGWLNDYEARWGDMPPKSRCPQCRSCGANLGYRPTPAKAIAAWNRRSPAPQAQPDARAVEARPAEPTQSAAQTGEALKARVDTLVNILAPDQGESLSEERRRLFAIASAIQSDLRALSQPEAGR